MVMVGDGHPHHDVMGGVHMLDHLLVVLPLGVMVDGRSLSL